MRNGVNSFETDYFEIVKWIGWLVFVFDQELLGRWCLIEFFIIFQLLLPQLLINQTYLVLIQCLSWKHQVLLINSRLGPILFQIFLILLIRGFR